MNAETPGSSGTKSISMDSKLLLSNGNQSLNVTSKTQLTNLRHTSTIQ